MRIPPQNCWLNPIQLHGTEELRPRFLQDSSPSQRLGVPSVLFVSMAIMAGQPQPFKVPNLHVSWEFSGDPPKETV